MRSDNYPVIVGVSQYTQPKNTRNPKHPLELMTIVTEDSIRDTSVSRIKGFIDTIYMININSWSYKDAPRELSDIIGITPKTTIYLPDGGNSPQMLLNRAAIALSNNSAKAILIVGAEAAYSTYMAQKGKISLNWPERKDPDYMEGKLWHGTTEFENNYEFIRPPLTYALFESALRAKSGASIQEHQVYLGRLFQKFSEISAKNRYSWSSKTFTPNEIYSASEKNRNVNHPYTKRMCANMFVDMSCSVLLTTERLAEELTIPNSRMVYLMGGANFENIFSVVRRPKLYNSPAIRMASEAALNQAGLSLDEIDMFDLYSCFPSIVQIAMKEIGIPSDDKRPLTITGGMSFFGAPWSNYSLHAIATAVELIRRNPPLKIMVIANGGYNTKESIGIYGKSPPQIKWGEKNYIELQKSLLTHILPEPVEIANGEIVVDAYTIKYTRDGIPDNAIIVGSFKDGRRTIVKMEKDLILKLKLETEELVGKTCIVKYDKIKKLNSIIE